MSVHRRRADLPLELAEWAMQIHVEVFIEPDGVVVEGLTFFRRYDTLADLEQNIFAPKQGGCSGRNRWHNDRVRAGYDEALARDAAARRVA